MDKIEIQGYVLEDAPKIERALNGSPTSKGTKGGVVKDDGSYDDIELLVEYDRIGGYITDKGTKVKTGSFYDLKRKTMRFSEETDGDGKVSRVFAPEVTHLYKLNGEKVEFKKGEEGPDFVDALQVIEKRTSEAREKRLAKRKKKDIK